MNSLGSKKEILFVCYGLGIGGIEKCLVNLINMLPEAEFGISILLMNPEYDLLPQLKRAYTLIDGFQYVMNTTDTMGQIRDHGSILRNPVKFMEYCCFRLMNKFGNDPWRFFIPLKESYDIAVAYSHDDWTKNYVLHKVRAKRKVLWYHNGAYEKSKKEQEKDAILFRRFDYVVAVSEDCRRILNTALRLDESKLVVLRNICDVDTIQRLADADDPEGFPKDKINIVTVGRLTKEKGADIALDTCKKLVNSGKNVLWHWVGDGNQRNVIEDIIEELNLIDHFVIEGSKTNPYPYIRKADLYVQPSYYEAYSTTITEAKVLKKPVVTTDVGGMRDQIEDGKNGWITEIDADSIAETIQRLIDHSEMIDKCKSELEKEDWTFDEDLDAYYNTVFSPV